MSLLRRTALIVAHGQPGAPEPQERALADLATSVARELPDWRIGSATLAMPGALAAAIAALDTPLVYPFFMAEGWFTGTELPRRLAGAGGAGLPICRPFGVEPTLPDLMRRAACQGALHAGFAPSQGTLLIAAHGSKISRRSADSTHAMAETLRATSGFANVTTGFVEEPPFLEDAARGLGPDCLCLPFFALAADHVGSDIPEALTAAGFKGLCLPPIGAHPETPRLIAAGLLRALGSLC